MKNLETELYNENNFEDVKQLLIYGHNFHANARPDVFIKDYLYTEQQINDMLNEQNSVCYVCKCNGKVVGVVFAKIIEKGQSPSMITSKVLLIDSIVVDEIIQKQGVGKQLMQKCEEYAKDNKLDSIQLNVWGFNENAIDFYKHLDMTIRSVVMGKKIS